MKVLEMMVARQVVLLLVGCAAILLNNDNNNNNQNNIIKVAYGLRITSIEVPSAVMNSSQVTLGCNYELQGDQLYSVKWYKNYVEFYRFQPSQSIASAQDLQQQLQQQQQQQQLNFGSKQEFELEGINLNLSKSNATHVYLKQTSLSSEGTYKCEISADSPSFATISSERQMKVYVLPRQKLLISDNTKQQQLATSSNTNDLVNLTCISAPSRPRAKLRWFINDVPISNSSKWLIHHHSQQQQQQQQKQQLSQTSHLNNQQQLIETRLTLVFRFQPNILVQLMTNNNNQTVMQSNNLNFHQLTNKHQLEFKCEAEFSLEFASETSIAVAGGKTSQPKKRNKEQPINIGDAGQSIASPLMDQPGEVIYSDHPRPINSLLVQTGMARLNRIRTDSRPLWTDNQTNLVGPIRHQQPQQQLTVQQQHQQGIVVLTNKQLRTKAEQIDQMLHQIRPNDIEPPLIEAKSQLFDYTDLELDQTGGEEATGEDNSPVPRVTGEEASGMTEEDSSYSARPDMHIIPNNNNNNNNNSTDYQLNESVLFTCSFQPAQMLNLQSDVHFTWLINDKETDSNHINHYDGHRFYLNVQQTDQKLARKKQPNKNPSFGQQLDESKHSNLLIEFTPSLFQLKELDLKCRTLIEQPLVSYETVLLANSNPSNNQQSNSQGYFENEQRGSSDSLHRNNIQNSRPWVLKTQHSQQQLQQQRRNQLRLQKQQQQQQSSSSASSSSKTLSFYFILEPILFILNILVVQYHVGVELR